MRYEFHLSDHEPELSKKDFGFVAKGKVIATDTEKGFTANWRPFPCNTLQSCVASSYEIPLHDSLRQVIMPENEVEVYMPPQHIQIYNKDLGNWSLIQNKTKLFLSKDNYQIIKHPKLEIRHMSSENIVLLQSPLVNTLNDLYKKSLSLRVSPDGNSKLYNEIHHAMGHYMMMRWGNNHSPGEFFWDIENQCIRWSNEEISFHETTAQSLRQKKQQAQQHLEKISQQQREYVKTEYEKTQKENVQSSDDFLKTTQKNMIPKKTSNTTQEIPGIWQKSSQLPQEKLQDFVKSFNNLQDVPDVLQIQSKNIPIAEFEISLGDIPLSVFSVAVCWLLNPSTLPFDIAQSNTVYLDNDGLLVSK